MQIVGAALAPPGGRAEGRPYDASAATAATAYGRTRRQ
jgi:hypothetical protein